MPKGPEYDFSPQNPKSEAELSRKWDRAKFDLVGCATLGLSLLVPASGLITLNSELILKGAGVVLITGITFLTTRIVFYRGSITDISTRIK